MDDQTRLQAQQICPEFRYTPFEKVLGNEGKLRYWKEPLERLFPNDQLARQEVLASLPMEI